MESALSRPVVFFTNSPFMGGMEEHIVTLAGGLVERGLRVAVLCSNRDEIVPFRRSLREAGVELHPLAERRSGALGPLGRVRQLADTLRRYPSSIVHMHLTGHNGGELVQLAARLAGASAVVRTEHLPPLPPTTPRERLQVRLRDTFLDRVICVSAQTRDDHVARLGRAKQKFRVVQNSVDVERFAGAAGREDVRLELGLDPRAPVIGTVSRMNERRKGLHDFLDMAAAVVAVQPSARFVMVGEGPLQAELEEQAQALGIAEAVVFTGRRRDIPRLLAAMDVFVMSSLYEGGPITVLEAMASGLPTVATRVGMVPDAIVDGETGILVEPGDTAALTRGVLRLLTDPDLAARLGSDGRHAVKHRFSPQAMVDGVLDVYREV